MRNIQLGTWSFLREHLSASALHHLPRECKERWADQVQVSRQPVFLSLCMAMTGSARPASPSTAGGSPFALGGRWAHLLPGNLCTALHCTCLESAAAATVCSGVCLAIRWPRQAVRPWSCAVSPPWSPRYARHTTDHRTST